MPSHHPPHLYLDNTWYLVTAATFHRRPLLAGEHVKQLVRDTLERLAQEHTVSLRAWVILDDHYHLLLRTRRGDTLSRFFQQLHGSTARQINANDSASGRQVWQNFWDTCIRTENDLWTRFNYIHINPVKHGYVRRPDEWPYSSYHHYLRAKGDAWIGDCLSRYPVADVLDGDAFDLAAPDASTVDNPQTRALSTPTG